MKKSENNCNLCGYNADYIDNASEKIENRLCGACLNIYELEKEN